MRLIEVLFIARDDESDIFVRNLKLFYFKPPLRIDYFQTRRESRQKNAFLDEVGI